MSINKLTYDGKFYRWNGSLDELKSFVEQQLKLHGSWTSPGGETKVFRSEESDFIIKWYGVSSKKIVIQVDNNESYLELLSEKLVSLHEESGAVPEVATFNKSCDGDALAVKTSLNSLSEAIQGLQVLKPQDKISRKISEVHVRESDRFNKQMVCYCNCTCSSNVTRAEFEGVKLDMTILEYRFLNTSSLDEIKSEIKILKQKQNDMEVVINRQDDLICKINEENMVLKSKLFAIEFLMQDNPRCDENNNSRGPLQSAEPNDKSQECEQMININLPTINTVSSVNTNKTPSHENNGMVISTKNCISDSSNSSSSTGNFIQHDAGVSLANSLSQPKTKNLVPCSLLRRRGYCLKGSRCDFLHNDTQSSTSGVQPQFRQIPISAHPFSYVAPPNSSQNPLSFEPTFFPR